MTELNQSPRDNGRHQLMRTQEDMMRTFFGRHCISKWNEPQRPRFIAAILLSGLVSATMTADGKADSKKDILGYTTGVPIQEITTKLPPDLKCSAQRDPSPISFTKRRLNPAYPIIELLCRRNDLPVFTFKVTSVYRSHTVDMVQYAFGSSAPKEDLVSSISKQFGVDPTRVSGNQLEIATWELPDGLSLNLWLGGFMRDGGVGYYLTLYDQSLFDEDEKAWLQMKAQSVNPNPKF